MSTLRKMDTQNVVVLNTSIRFRECSVSLHTMWKKAFPSHFYDKLLYDQVWKTTLLQNNNLSYIWDLNIQSEGVSITLSYWFFCFMYF